MEIDASTLKTNGHSTTARVDPEVLNNHGILLFDGVCNLCNGFVNRVIDHDPEAYFQMAALQSEEARPYLDMFDVDPEEMDSVVLIEDGRVYKKSTAALRVALHLPAPWPMAIAFMAVPRVLRDYVYDIVAENRYNWFGERNACRMPTPEVQRHFLGDE
jgi:predicted DCC family thiol-disulfide oxidoreductase YuxK